MPRLNNDRYYQRHLLLRQIWIKNDSRFSLLSPDQQWDVHAYYKPSHALTEAEAVAHRRQISNEHPSLPARASRAFKILVDGSRDPRQTGTIHILANGRRISIRAVMRPDPDIEKLARAFLMLAEQMADEKRWPNCKNRDLM